MEAEYSHIKKKFRFWATVMISICLALGIVVYGAGRYSFGVFMTPLADSMGWTRTEISAAVSINLVSYGLLSPVVGWMFTRFGVRWVMIIGALLTVISLLSMYFVTQLWMLYILYGVMLAFGVNAVGRIGQATLVTYWFVKNRGLMLGITSVSIGLGTAIMAPLVRLILDTFGWRLAFVIVGLIVAITVLLPIVLFVKGSGKPEDRGFEPDGELLKINAEVSGLDVTVVSNIDKDWSVADAVRTKLFWVITMSMAVSFMADYVVLFHGPAAFEDRGLSGPMAAFILSVGAFASCIGRIGIGWLSDVINIKMAFLVCFGVQVIAAPFIFIGDEISTLYIFAFLWGVGYGGGAVIGPYAFADYFGRKNFSTIYGIGTMIMVFFGAAGGMIGGMVYDGYQNYHAAWIICGVLWPLSFVIVLFGMRDNEKIA